MELWQSLNWSRLFLLSTTLSTFFPFVVGLRQYRLLSRSQKWSFWFVVLSMVLMLLSNIMWLTRTNNLFIGHFYLIVQVIVILRVFQLEMSGLIKEKIFYVVMVFFILFTIVNTVYLQPITMHNTYARNLAHLILSVLAVLYFFQLIKSSILIKVERLFMFWFSAAVLLYFLSTLFIFTIANVIQPYESLTLPVWTIHAGLLWLFFTLLGIGLCVQKKPSK